jgi:hypothetical protein
MVLLEINFRTLHHNIIIQGKKKINQAWSLSSPEACYQWLLLSIALKRNASKDPATTFL